MNTFRKAITAGLVAVIAVLCWVQAGCSEQCDCSDAVGAAIKAERAATNKAIEDVAEQNKALVGDIEKLKKQATDGGACLAREEARKKGEEMKRKTEVEACDADLIDSAWMEDGVCSFDPQKASPFRQLSTEEKLAEIYVHSLKYRDGEYYFSHALECPEGGAWSKYTREQVQARYNCLQGQYYKAHKDVVLYTKPLGMHFAVPGEDGYGYEPALRVVLDIMRDVDRDQGASLSDFGVTLAQLTTAYQLRFKEALEFYETRVRVCEEGKDTFNDRDGVLVDQLCDLVTDFSLYAAYPDPLKGVTRAEMAKRLKCKEDMIDQSPN